MSDNIYVTAAFKSVNKNQAYIFIRNEFVLEDYAPDTRGDKILRGPSLIGDYFSSLKNTVFENQGIDSAFASHDYGEAYIFSGNKCARWFYAPDGYAKDTIRDGPKTIAEMFPFFRGTVFESGVDAAFESSIRYEAYLFKGEKYARIDYSHYNARLINLAPIYKYWPCLIGTIYENGFDAAFTLHTPNEAYLFKGPSYARLSFTPGAWFDQLRWSQDISRAWPDLASILPRKRVSRIPITTYDPPHVPRCPPNNQLQKQVTTSVTLTNETGTGSIKRYAKKDWSGSITNGNPTAIDYIPNAEKRIFLHQGYPHTNGSLGGSMGALIYVGPRKAGDTDNCAWLVAWSAPCDGTSNKVYVDSGTRSKLRVNWEDVKRNLLKSGPFKSYTDPKTRAEVYANIENDEPKSTYDLDVTFSFNDD